MTFYSRRTYLRRPDGEGITARTGTQSTYRDERPPMGVWLALTLLGFLAASWVALIFWFVPLLGD
jgi:hypothetical protein